MPNIIKCKIDLAKIHGARVLKKDTRTFIEITDAQLFEGKNGAIYLDFALFETPQSQFGDSHRITQDLAKPLRDAGQRGAILGNAKTQNYGAPSGPAPAPRAPAPAPSTAADEDDDVPF